MFFRGGHPVSDRALNGYVSGELTPAERFQVEAHVAGCAACRQAIAELAAMRSTLQALPRASAPRSFALYQADIVPARRTATGWALRASPLVGAVATMALLAFFSLVSVDLADRTGGGETAGLSRAASRASFDAYQAPPAGGSADQGPPQGGVPQLAGTPVAGTGSAAPDVSPAPPVEATAPAGPQATDGQATALAVRQAAGGAVITPSSLPPFGGENGGSAGAPVPAAQATEPTSTVAPGGATEVPPPYLALRIDEATAAALSSSTAKLVGPTAPEVRGAPATALAATPTPLPQTVKSGEGDRTGLRVAEAATAALAVVSGGAFAFVWRRRRT